MSAGTSVHEATARLFREDDASAQWYGACAVTKGRGRVHWHSGGWAGRARRPSGR